MKNEARDCWPVTVGLMGLFRLKPEPHTKKGKQYFFVRYLISLFLQMAIHAKRGERDGAFRLNKAKRRERIIENEKKKEEKKKETLSRISVSISFFSRRHASQLSFGWEELSSER